MFTIEQIREKLKGYRYEEVAGACGLSYQGVRLIMRGVVNNPSLETAQKLVKFIEEMEEK